ncbi:chromaffin granule amine transporter-like isoform X2 [Pararge aegeria]|uniref:chromaffin granule amine transporter-like isoform X2 n=1 Tax=Pararge aegeria TaxID=116150 RepID=UPI0019D1993A|nr:chromaffin granule amine transporter-like isoform X2 [Pararge aegeria]
MALNCNKAAHTRERALIENKLVLIVETHATQGHRWDYGWNSFASPQSFPNPQRIECLRMQEYTQTSGLVAFALVYLTFFLDNVLLTVLVPIIPDWVQGESLALWTEHGAPLAKLLNTTVHQITHQDSGRGVGTSQAIVGAVLGAKAATQLIVTPAAATLTACRGPATGLRLATALLATAALVFGCCAGRGGAVCAGIGRASQGAGAALGGVAGLALVARALPPHRRHRALAALLGAVALGVLVGYPFGGAAYKLWSPAAPFQLIATALLINLVMQYIFLSKEEYNTGTNECSDAGVGTKVMWAEARRGATGACAGAVLLTTCVMAALEPCLPLWIMHKFHPERWALGAVFLPDSAGYLVAASGLGSPAQRLGPERVAIAAVLCVGCSALIVPHAPSVGWLMFPQAALGGGLGAADAALVPALLAKRSRALPHRAALLQAASSAAYAIGPVLGGIISWCAGFETALRFLGVANILYAVYLYRVLSEYPLSEKWGTCITPEEESDEESDELTPLGITAQPPAKQRNTKCPP